MSVISTHVKYWKIINQAVIRNSDRFSEKFCFRLTEGEVLNSYGGRRKPPTVFTKQRIAMLSELLKNKIAVQVRINIIARTNKFMIDLL